MAAFDDGLADTEPPAHAIVETDLFRNPAVADAQHGRPRELHLPSSCRWQRSNEEVAEGWTGVRAAAFPTADDVVALGDEISGPPEIEVRKRFTEVGHEGRRL